MNKYLLILSGIVVMLSGCSLAPSYTRPEAPLPAAWPSGPAYSEQQAAPKAFLPENTPWQEFFTDKRLQQVIKTALVNNRDLRLAALNVQRAQALYGIKRWELFPSLGASANGSRQRVPADLSTTGKQYTAEQYDVSLGVFAWEVDFFGRLQSLKDQALESFLATEQAHRSTQILIISAVADAYLTFAADQDSLALSQTTFESQKQAYNLIKERYKDGLASEIDLNRAQTQVEIARRDMALYTQQVAQDENALNLLVGTRPPLARATFPQGLASIAPLKVQNPGISSQVLLARPDILQAENLLKAANANIGAARASLFPRVSLTSTVGTASSELSDLFESGSGTWLFAPKIGLPIFDGRLWSALDVSKVDREIALVQYEKTIETAFREVADTLAVLGTVDQRLAAQQSLTRTAAATYGLADVRYTNGIDDYLSVLDAHRSLYAAQQELVVIHLAKLTSEVRLYAALGGGTK